MTDQTQTTQDTNTNRAVRFLKKGISRIKSLRGDPHYIAMGMGIGIFVSATPFFPFHTSIAVVLSLLLKGSKSAAAIGVWLSNPLTLPFFYLASYKTGALCLGSEKQVQINFESFSQIIEVGMDVTVVMIVGGVLIGVILAPVAYFATHRFFSSLHRRCKVVRHGESG